MDETKAKSAVEELRAVVMCLYRSAGNLDNILQSIELELDGTKSDSLYTKAFCRSKRMYREDVMKAAGFSGLDNLEAEAWNKLLEAFSKESES